MLQNSQNIQNTNLYAISRIQKKIKKFLEKGKFISFWWMDDGGRLVPSLSLG